MIIVVGNGPIKGKGEYIDSFDTVVRINDAPLELSAENKADVGEKIDIWAFRHKMYMFKKYGVKLGDVVKKRLQVLGCGIWDYSMMVSPTCTFRKWIKTIASRHKIQPTTGFATVYWCIEHESFPIHIIGFTRLESGNQLHYWDKSSKVTATHQGRHNIEKEWEIMEGWFNDGKLCVM